jgi:sugar phosphate isomerase/epimerase
MQPCYSAATTLPCTFADDLAHCADAGCRGLEIWLPKLETHLEQHRVAATRQLVTERGLQLVAAAYQGGLLLSEGAPRQAHYDHLCRRLDICQQFQIPTLLIVADHAESLQPGDWGRAVASLAQAAAWAASYDVRLALEFRSKHALCTSLDTALALVHQSAAPNVGINFDVFHYYTGPSKFEDLGLLTADRLFHVQLCDLAGVAREWATDSDRILPGDGDFQLQPILDHFRQIGYTGWVSVELMNPTLWQANPKQVVEIAITALRKLLGQA